MLTLTLAALALTGCKEVEPAPQDLDGLLHALWGGYEADDDLALAELVDALHDEVGGDTFAELEDGSLTALEDSAADGLPITPAPDVGAARGLYLLNVYGCDLAQLERILYHQDQGDLYDDAYETYRREYTSDLDAYIDRSAPSVSWSVELTGELVGASFTEWLDGGLRYLPDSGQGPALLARTYMTQPSQFEEGSSKSFDQDYQIELFYERAPGEVLHAYGMWRSLDMGGGLTMEDDAVVRVILNNLADWDEHTAALCAEGRP